MVSNVTLYNIPFLKTLFFIFLCTLLFPACVFASSHDETSQANFAMHLYKQGEYFRAITEGKRYLFLFPDGKHTEKVLVLIADSYRDGGDEEGALVEYERFKREFPDSTLVVDVLYRIGRLLADNRKYKEASLYFDRITTHPNSSEMQIENARQWKILLALLTDKPSEEVNELVKQYSLEENREVESVIDEYEKINFKSPRLAGLYSTVIPGAGQLYIGRKRDATAAFVLNGLFIWGAFEAFNDDKVGIGILLTVFEVGWYSGNIYSAISGAHKHNRKRKDSFRKNMSLRLNIYANNEDKVDGAGILFSYNF